MEAESVIVSVRRRIVSKLDELTDVDTPSLAWSTALEALMRIATAPSSNRRTILCVAGYLHSDAPQAGPEALIELAAAIELHHLFVLALDDVIDGGSFRRGQPTLHRALRGVVSLGDSQRLAGLLAGVVQTQAALMMARVDRRGRATERVLQATSRAGIAQFRDVVGFGPEELAGEDLQRFLFEKGGDHAVAAPLVAGALLADPETPAASTLERWARHIGIAFQGIDDLLDYLASPLDTGKDAFQDFVNRRPSLLTCLLHDALGSAEASAVMNAPLTPGYRRRIAGLIDAHRVVPRAVELITDQLAAAEEIAAPGCLPEPTRRLLAEVSGRLALELRSARQGATRAQRSAAVARRTETADPGR